jgi:hypothetical protein
MNFKFPEGPPGIHPPTATLARMMEVNGVVNPLTTQPYSEAMLLGIGGGLDIGYILYTFNHLPHPMLILGFRNQWNNTQVFMESISERLMLSVKFSGFDDSNEAQAALQTALEQGKQAIVWVDKALLLYHQLPETYQGFFNHQVGVYARDGRLWRLFLDDLSTQAIQIKEKTFTSARENLSQNDFLMMVFHHAHFINTTELRDAILQGIRDCAQQLTRPINTVGISNLETWAAKLIDRYDQQGWPQLFEDQSDLFPVFQNLYESIKLIGTEGFALRKMYADFLQEAAGILKNPALNAIAGQYLQLANHWSSLAENALPSNVPQFDKIKSLLHLKVKAYQNANFEEYSSINEEIESRRKKIVSSFPLSSSETYRLFLRLSSQVKLIAELETNAAYRLLDISRR